MSKGEGESRGESGGMGVWRKMKRTRGEGRREGLGERKWGNDAGVGGKRKRVG